MTAGATPNRFVRDRTTWLGYLLMGTSTFGFAILGPMMPFLRAELHINLTVAAYHFSSWSLGSLIAGCIGDTLINRFGRQSVVWTAAAIVSACLLVFAFSQQVYYTVAAALLAGICASTIAVSINSLMSTRFGEQRAIGITEATIVGSIFCSAAPLVVSGLVRNGMSWRATPFVPIVLYALAFLSVRTLPSIVQTKKTNSSSAQHLPPVYWAYWSVIVLSVGCEWSIILWSPEFLEHVTHLARPDAVAAVSTFLVAVLLGRILGRNLAARFDTQTLLPYAAMVALIGFLTFWLNHSAHLSIIGLFICGLGTANFYPLTLSSALSVAPDSATKATARLSIGTGFSVLTAPLALGYVADHQGIFFAYGIVALLLCLCLGMVFVANRHARLHSERHDFQLEPLPIVASSSSD